MEYVHERVFKIFIIKIVRVCVCQEFINSMNFFIATNIKSSTLDKISIVSMS